MGINNMNIIGCINPTMYINMNIGMMNDNIHRCNRMNNVMQGYKMGKMLSGCSTSSNNNEMLSEN
jgi:hypothetical protein